MHILLAEPLFTFFLRRFHLWLALHGVMICASGTKIEKTPFYRHLKRHQAILLLLFDVFDS